MTLSSFTAWSQITEGADAAPDTFNNPLSVISQNLDQLNTDAASNLSTSQVTIGDTLSVDTIVEYTSANGVDIDGVLLKDSDVSASVVTIASGLTVGDMYVRLNPSREAQISWPDASGTGVARVLMGGSGNTLDLNAATGGVRIRDGGNNTIALFANAGHFILGTDPGGGNLLRVGGTGAFGGILSTNTINEFNTDSGIDIDGVYIKDSDLSTEDLRLTQGGIAANTPFLTGLNFFGDTDTNVGLGTQGTGILYFLTGGSVRANYNSNVLTFTSNTATVRLDGGTLLTDTINEDDTNQGVTVEGVLIRDSGISTDNIYETTAAAGVTIDSVLLKDSDVSASEVVLSGQTIAVRGTHTPASGTASGETGDITWDTDFVYVCVSTDSWARAALSRF